MGSIVCQDCYTNLKKKDSRYHVEDLPKDDMYCLCTEEQYGLPTEDCAICNKDVGCPITNHYVSLTKKVVKNAGKTLN